MSGVEVVALDYEPVGSREIIAGDPGVGIASASVDGSGDLTLTMTDGTTRGPWHVGGDAGPANTLTASAVTGAPGSAAAATITGESPSQHLEITVPSGLPGTAATVAVDPASGGVPYGTPTSVTNTGTPSAAKLLVKVQEGQPGGPGAPGKNLEFAWLADTLGVRQQGDTTYTYSQSLTGPAGSASTYEYWGQGRPDVAGSLDAGGTAWVSAATQGAVFHSTTGDQGAQVWTKTAAGWIVTVGDTGKRDITVGLTSGFLDASNTGTVVVSRVARLLRFEFHGVTFAAAGFHAAWTAPAGFRGADYAQATVNAIATASSGAQLVMYMVRATGTLYSIVKSSSSLEAGFTLPCDDPWPSTLPGVPA